MNPKTLKALKGSVRHWERILLGIEKGIGSRHCPLCRMFNNDNTPDPACHGCPVYKKTGGILCDHSPYYAFANIWRGQEHTAETLILAFNELQFLRSLLPKKRKP